MRDLNKGRHVSISQLQFTFKLILMDGGVVYFDQHLGGEHIKP